ncbi:hypothetical protein, partial [Pseudomonas aeruginosa]
PKLRFSPVTQFDGTTLLATGQIPQGCSAQTYMSLLDHPGYTAGAVRCPGGPCRGCCRPAPARCRAPR